MSEEEETDEEDEDTDTESNASSEDSATYMDENVFAVDLGAFGGIWGDLGGFDNCYHIISLHMFGVYL